MKLSLAAALLALSLAPAAAQPPTVIGFFTADARPGQDGDLYRVALQVQEGRLVAKIQALGAGSKEYADVADLQAAGQVTGEAMLVSEQGRMTHLKSLMDPMEYEAGMVGPWLTFRLKDKPAAGAYRLWVEVKRGGRELAFPFALTY